MMKCRTGFTFTNAVNLRLAQFESESLQCSILRE